MISETPAAPPPVAVDETLDELRPRLIAAMLPSVAFDGWTRASVLEGAAAAGIDPDLATVAFRGGALEMVEAYIALADARMLAALGDLSQHKIRERIRLAVTTPAPAGGRRARGRAADAGGAGAAPGGRGADPVANRRLDVARRGRHRDRL